MKESVQLTKEMFQPVKMDNMAQNQISRPSVGFWKDVWRRFYRNAGAMIGVVLLAIILFFTFIGPSMGKTDYQTQNLSLQDMEPTIQSLISGDDYRFGTDNLGRDLWTRVWYGTKISLMIAFLAAILEIALGVMIGVISGYFGGIVDDILQRVIEVLYSIPNTIVVILLLIVFEPGILPIALALALTNWLPTARVVRAQVLKLKSQEYVLAAKTLGASHFRIMFKHLLPNVIGPIIVAIMFAIPTAIFYEAFLSFIGLGIRPPEASLGVIINDGAKNLQIFPHELLIPAIVLGTMMLSFNLIGDGLRDALDPRMRK
ncbi:ABC transporter permease [Thermoflavimicrobium dichotomicum]|uniref:Oligopeptide transport system permease protein n=1 Tax=Thermoflavimicrobium dichotomicum TaxID=46223 RepID=A0A1I3LQL5_9BACL|nr:ABC transporter permease [Thermoflavimicrobium dichotomicum]SFI87038.1 oligopeptide transport system permease protein [Thermoflavimicrobium dichotomicum]